jgi:hypothetical protein
MVGTLLPASGLRLLTHFRLIYIIFRTFAEPIPVRPRRTGVAELIVGTEALASGRVTRHDLRARYVKLHRMEHDGFRPTGLQNWRDLASREQPES